jgi:hypothetical protein
MRPPEEIGTKGMAPIGTCFYSPAFSAFNRALSSNGMQRRARELSSSFQRGRELAAKRLLAEPGQFPELFSTLFTVLVYPRVYAIPTKSVSNLCSTMLYLIELEV